jgi:hypothetical protein
VPYVQETVDKLGRTIELRFFNYNNELDYAGSGFYGGPIIKFDYYENKIIETFFISENEYANDFRNSEVPYRFVYYLNSEYQIINTEMVYKIDFEWTKESIEGTIKHLEFYKEYAMDGSDLNEVFGYQYAQAKYNGKNPKLKE